ncbi:MAG: GGDEF domain-containing protein [Paracoccaceae bacterium]
MEKIFDQLSDVVSTGSASAQERLMTPKEFVQLTADEVDRASRYDRPLAVSVMLFDGLASYRQAEGQRRADEMVERLLIHLVGLLRGPDRLARLGPSDIGIIMPETTLKNAAAVAERIRRGVADEAQAVTTDKHKVTSSIGVAAMSPRMRDPKRFLMMACFELRRAQSNGGDTVCVAAPDRVQLSIPRSGQIH